MKRIRLGPWSFAPLLALCCLGYAQEPEGLPAEGLPGVRRPPQGLRRLAGLPNETGGSVIPADAISIVDLGSPSVAGSVGRIASQGKTRYLALPPGAEWSVPLRSLRTGANYTTFTLLASVGSIVSVDGALVTLAKGAHGYATVMAGYRKDQAVEWESLNHHVPVQSYSGQPMGSLSVITICTDTESRRWSITLMDQLSAHDLPLGPVDPAAPRVLSVKAGPAGAWLCGVATSDENPVFDDANHNGIRDSFETTLLGAPLARHASHEARDALFNLWDQRFELQPSDYSPARTNGAAGPVWKNAPSNYFLEIPYADPTEEPAIRGVPGIPDAVIFNPNGTRP